MERSPRSHYTAIRKAFYPQAALGILANSLLLFLHASGSLVGAKPKPTDLTVTHLAGIHILMLLTMGLLVSTDPWGAQGARSDFRCKVAVFLHKAARGLSLCVTCLLSVLQAVTLSPHGSCLASFKCRSHRPLLCLFLSSWLLAASIGSNLLLYTVATTSNATRPSLVLTDHCSFLPMSHLHSSLFFSLMGFRDVFFVGLMAASSGYMGVLLGRHKWRSWCAHTSAGSPRGSAVNRATRTILLLSGCFVVLYCADSAISLATVMTWARDPVVASVQILVANGYSTVSPLVLISGDTQIIAIMRTIWAKRGQQWTRHI